MCWEWSILCELKFDNHPLRLLSQQIWDGQVTYPDSRTLVAKWSLPSNLTPKLLYWTTLLPPRAECWIPKSYVVAFSNIYCFQAKYPSSHMYSFICKKHTLNETAWDPFPLKRYYCFFINWCCDLHAYPLSPPSYLTHKIHTGVALTILTWLHLLQQCKHLHIMSSRITSGSLPMLLECEDECCF